MEELAVFEEEKLEYYSYFPFHRDKSSKVNLRLTHFLASKIFLNRIMISHLTIKECSAVLATEITCVGKKKENQTKS